MVRIEIDGKELEAEQGSMIIEVADNNNIPIPRFCYHKKLSIAANCRMCLVEVDKARKPLPACATPVTDGMKVWTKSEAAIAAQKSVMEFLLINHPLDCPICDQGGECELQDVSLEYGTDSSRFSENKTVVKDKNIGPLISTDMTRCILCTRCVRFGEQVAGTKELGSIGRGAFTEISTFVEQSLSSEVSGNVIDLCPVGALTNKPFRFKARSWELKAFPSIAPHDCIGSNIFIHSRRGEALRVVPRENETVNDVWISDRDRYSIEAVNHPNRLQKPLIKQRGKWVEATWDKALTTVTKKLKQIVKNNGAESLATIISPNATLEEQYLAQRITRGLGSNNIDHRLRQNDFAYQEHAPLFPELGIGVNEIEQQHGILIVGSNITKEQPIASLNIRKAEQAGAKIFTLNPVDFNFNFTATNKLIADSNAIVNSIVGITKAVVQKSNAKVNPEASKLLAKVEPNEVEINIANSLLSLENRLILIGTLIQSDANYSKIIAFANILATILHAKLGVLSDGANSAGAWVSGCIPHRNFGGVKLEKPGLNAKDILTKDKAVKAYCLLGTEPELDSCYGLQATEALEASEFVVSCSAFNSEQLKQVSDVILPIASFAETSGTYINVAGDWQTFVGAANPKGESRPLWKILRVCANLLALENFEYNSSEEILQEIKTKLSDKQIAEVAFWNNWYPELVPNLDKPSKSRSIVGDTFTRVPVVPLYATDITVRHANPLQQTNDAISQHCAWINTSMASKLRVNDQDLIKVQSNDVTVELPVKIDDGVPDLVAIIPQGILATAKLSVSDGKVSIVKS